MQFTVPQSWLSFRYKAWEFKSFYLRSLSTLHYISRSPKASKSYMPWISLISQAALASESGRSMMQLLPVRWPCTEICELSCKWTRAEFPVANSCSPTRCCRLFSQPVSAVYLCVGSCHHAICSSPYVSVALGTAENATWWLASLWVLHVCVCKSVCVYICVFIKYHVYLCQCQGSQNKLWLSSIPPWNSCFRSRLTSRRDLGA